MRQSAKLTLIVIYASGVEVQLVAGASFLNPPALPLVLNGDLCREL